MAAPKLFFKLKYLLTAVDSDKCDDKSSQLFPAINFLKRSTYLLGEVLLKGFSTPVARP